MVVHTLPYEFLMITNELFKKQSLFKWVLVILTGEKKKNKCHHDVVAHTVTEKSDCDGAELLGLAESVM